MQRTITLTVHLLYYNRCTVKITECLPMTDKELNI